VRYAGLVALAAVQRGQRPEDVLSTEEFASIHETSVGTPPGRSLDELRHRPELLVMLDAAASLVGLGVSMLEVSIAGGAVAAIGILLWSLSRLRTARLTRAVDAALSDPADRRRLFSELAAAFEQSWRQDYASLVAWHEDGSDGAIELGHGANDVAAAELMSWLFLEGESHRDLIIDDGGELGRRGASIAVPLRRESSELVGFLVLGGSGSLPRHVLPLPAHGSMPLVSLSRLRRPHRPSHAWR
jgi:hypothetical protein